MNAGAAYLRPATDGRPWRNWQTRTVQVRVPKGVVVRLHSGAPFSPSPGDSHPGRAARPSFPGVSQTVDCRTVAIWVSLVARPVKTAPEKYSGRGGDRGRLDQSAAHLGAAPAPHPPD